MKVVNTCIQCGNKNEGKFCSECGLEFSKIICNKCGEAITGKFCQNCGNSLHEISNTVRSFTNNLSGTSKTIRAFDNSFEINKIEIKDSKSINLDFKDISMFYIKLSNENSKSSYLKLVLDNSIDKPKYNESFLLNDQYSIEFNNQNKDDFLKFANDFSLKLNLPFVLDNGEQQIESTKNQLESRSFLNSVSKSFNRIVEVQNEKQAKFDEKKRYLDEQDIAYCPKCLSTSLSSHKKGFGIGKAIVGAAVTGGIGLVAGNIGAKKVRVTCLKCGYQFWAGK